MLILQECALGYAALTGELEPFGPIICASPSSGFFIGFFLWLAAATIGCGGPEGCLG